MQVAKNNKLFDTLGLNRAAASVVGGPNWFEDERERERESRAITCIVRDASSPHDASAWGENRGSYVSEIPFFVRTASG